ncbi:hypothetical protein HANVADRAFT_111167 [Hanseniaspora valbyensis NRRL Y-1626]|uniref:Synchronized import protein 1 n=1 Tax=Hanseniaspora valbyensis NRRL Y-1626 TaxID=766949 RepID=A0A1B7TGS4_9ASCO|nr:hypothetical protein HANVADRAFT_111167 [Hanseniaspora valbyensis NRRL Y-1626]
MGKVNKRNKRSKNVSKQVQQIQSSKFQNLLKQIDETVIPNDKLALLNQINNMILQDTGKNNISMKDCKQMINIILNKLLTDSNTTIKLDSVGILRNIILLITQTPNGTDEDLIEYIWNEKQMWNVLKNGMENSSISLNNLISKSDSSIKQEEYEMLVDYIDNLLNILTLILTFRNDDSVSDEDTSSVMMDFLNGDKLEETCNFLLKIFEYCLNGKNKYNYRLLNACLEFLYEFATQSLQFLEYLFSQMPNLLEVIKTLKLSKENKMFNTLLIGLNIQINELESNNTENFGSYFKEIINNLEDIDYSIENSKLEAISDSKLNKNVNILEISLDLIIANLKNIGIEREEKKLDINTPEYDEILNVILPNFFQKTLQNLQNVTDFDSLIIRLLLCWNNYVLVNSNKIYSLDTIISSLLPILEINNENSTSFITNYRLTTLTTLINSNVDNFMQLLIRSGNKFIKLNDVQTADSCNSMLEQIMTLYLKDNMDDEGRMLILTILVSLMKTSSENLSNIGKFLLSLFNIERDETLLITVFYKLFEIFGVDEQDIKEDISIKFNKLQLDQVYENLQIQSKLTEISKNSIELKNIIKDKHKMKELTHNLNSFLQYKLYN